MNEKIISINFFFLSSGLVFIESLLHNDRKQIKAVKMQISQKLMTRPP